ncbi:hypothetical protein HZH68_002437 [Vespula germanica]|uniref:Uncharacterized protein n=1 Tax=Vespula germanica TaxID=30212 RepID=A0A834NMA2_VESGE|nr:hypothetical protein HZH68_002437 [Vespula germanica]
MCLAISSGETPTGKATALAWETLYLLESGVIYCVIMLGLRSRLENDDNNDDDDDDDNDDDDDDDDDDRIRFKSCASVQSTEEKLAYDLSLKGCSAESPLRWSRTIKARKLELKPKYRCTSKGAARK